MMALCGLILGRCIVLLLILEILILGIRYRYTVFTTKEQNVSVDRVTNSYPIQLEEHEDRSVADELATKVRVLCWVMTNPNTLEKARHVKATWGKRCNKLLFMSTTEDESLPTVNLPVEEGTHYLWGKTKAAFNYVYQHYRNEADWFLKADDDTYVIVENLRYMLSKYDSNKPLYFGCRFKVNNQSYMSGGAGYLLSRAALESLVERGLSGSYLCKWRNIGLEDILLGNCLEALGVTSVDTRDSLRRGRFYPFTLYDHMFPTINRDFWYWHYVYYPADDGPNCCSDLAISFHYISPQHMHELEYYVYRLRPFGINYNTRILPTQTNKGVASTPTRITVKSTQKTKDREKKTRFSGL